MIVGVVAAVVAVTAVVIALIIEHAEAASIAIVVAAMVAGMVPLLALLRKQDQQSAKLDQISAQTDGNLDARIAEAVRPLVDAHLAKTTRAMDRVLTEHDLPPKAAGIDPWRPPERPR